MIERYLKEWEKAPSIDAFLDKNLAVPDRKSLNQYLEDKPAKRKTEILSKLSHIEKEVTEYAKTKRQEMKESLKEFEKDTKRISAHAKYTKRQGDS